jgi:hypothetical protein
MCYAEGRLAALRRTLVGKPRGILVWVVAWGDVDGLRSSALARATLRHTVE